MLIEVRLTAHYRVERNIAEEYRAQHGWKRVSTLQRTDPPIHTSYRRLVAKAFLPKRIREMTPHIDEVCGELIDGLIDAGECEFHMDFAMPLPGTIIAEELGLDRAEIHRFTPVTATRAQPDGTWIVETPKGNIHTDWVINAAGLWGREVAALAGVELPLQPTEHQYFVTETIPEIAAIDRRLPSVADRDGEYYMRQEGKGLLIGA